MTARRLISLVAAGALAGAPGAAWSDAPPSPPPDHPPRVLSPGQQVELEPAALPAPLGPELVTVPPAGALYLDQPAWVYQVELRRYYEARVTASEAVAERQAWKGLAWGAGIGLAIGIAVGALARR